MKPLNIIKSLTSHMLAYLPLYFTRYASKRLLVMTLPIPRFVLLSLPLLSLFLTANVQAQDVTAPDAPVFTTLNGTNITSITATQYTNSLPFTLSGTAEAGSTVKVFDLRRAPGPQRTLVKGNLPVASATADSTTGVWTVSISAESERGAFVATATDTADNTSVDSSRVFITLDNTPPALPAISTTTQTVSAAAFTLTGTASNTSDTVNVLKGGTLIHSGIPVTGGSVFAHNSDNTWSIDVTLTPGANVFTATATDRAGNTSGATAAVTITLDVANPTATITSTSGASGASVSADSLRYTVTFGAVAVTGFALSDITVTGTANSGSPVASNLQGTGASYTFDVAKGNSDGTVIVSIAANQVSNNLASNQLTLTIDTTPPSVAITTTSQETTTALFTIQGTTSLRGLDLGIVTVRKAGSDEVLAAGISSSGTWAIEVDLEQGDNTFTATATDGAGNTSGATAAVIITRVAPSVTITSVSPPGGTGLRLDDDDTKQQRRLKYRVAFSGETVARAHDFTPSDITVTGTANGGSPVADSVGAEVTEAGRFLGYTFEVKRGSSDGTVTVSIPAGAIGNSPASNELTLTIDTTPPSVAITTAGQTVNTLPFTIEGTAEAGALIQLLRGAALSVIATTTAAADGTWAIPFDLTVTPNGGAQNREVPSVNNSMRVSAIDGAGNIALSNYANIRVRTRAPDISVSSNMLIATIGTAITPIIIINDGGAVSATGAYSISPNLPPGLSIDTSTGTISGTPTRVANEQAYIITYTTTTGDEFFVTPSSATVTITVNAVAPNISIPNTLIANVGTAITLITAINTGGPVTSYSISPNLNERTGLDFNTSTGTISGTPTKVANEQAYIITATNSGGTNDATVTITVSAAVPIISASVSTLIATQAVAITPITIMSTGGAVASYSIDPDLPAGLLIDASDGSISGIPAMASNAQAYTITATGPASGGIAPMATITITITVNAAAPNITIIPSTLTATQFVAITPTTIRSIGGAATSYSINPDLPAGLSIDTSTGSISGTPTAVAGAETYTITATNSGGTNDATIAITVNPAVPIISASVTALTATQFVAITPITIMSTGGAVTSYSIDPDLPAGLLIDTATGRISGIPAMASNEQAYIITATNTGGMNSAMVTITVNAPPVAVPIISISVATLIATVGTTITSTTIMNSGGAATSYSISPKLNVHTGLDFNTSIGSISGAPTRASNARTYTITATNTGGSDSASVTITIVDAPNISPSMPTLIATVGTAIPPITIDASAGGAVASYSISPNLPAGLSIDTSTGSISGTPTAVAGAETYTITANGVGMPTVTAIAMVTITVNAAAPIISADPSTLTATVGTAITATTIMNSGGAATSYSISLASNGQSLNANTGLSFNTANGMIFGTPTMAAGAETYTITATNSGGMATATVTITVNAAAPNISINPSTLTATVGTAIPSITIDAEAGGAVDSYSISPDLPAGLSIDPSSGEISGTPTAVAGAETYIITATNTTGTDTASVTITVNNVAPRISINPATLVANMGSPIVPITITPIGGGAVVSYSIAPDIQNGLMFDTGTGAISGTPTAVAEAITYTITATNSGGTATAMVTITVNAPDTTPPSVTISSLPESANIVNGDTVNATTLRYEVAFSELISGFEIDDITVTGTAAVTTASNLSGGVNGTGLFFQFEVLKGNLDGTVIVSIAENIAEDTAGNGNTASGDYTLTIDTTPPTITLNGDAALTLVRGTDYNDAGATASDNIGGDITSSITTSFTLDGTAVASLNSSLPGTYIITYDVSDAASNPAIAVTRTVTVVEAISPATNGVIATAAGDKIRLSFVDQQLTNNSAVPGDFSLSGAAAGITVTALAVDAADDTVLILTLSGNIAKDAAVTLTYTRTAGSISGVFSTGGISSNGIVIDFAATDVDTSSIVAEAAVADPSIIPSVTALTATQAVAITSITIDASAGGAVASYSISPDLPAGLLIDTATGTISGTPASPASVQTYIITATNTAGNDTASVEITVNAAAVADTAPSFAQGANIANQTHIVSTTITTLTLPEASGGNGALTYTLTPALPAGLSFDANARTLTGTPTMAASMQTYTYTVMDSDANMAGGDSASLMFTITVNAAAVADTAPSFAQGANIADQTHIVSTTITTLTLPEASGGNGALTYTLTPALPAGLSFDANARTLTGTPTMAASMQTYTYTVMDSDANIAGGDSASLMFTITVNAAAVADTAPSFAQGASIADQTHTVNTMITTLTLPEASGGNGALTYTLTPALPAGLSFNANARTISGIPTMAASMQTYTYTVMDSDANMAGGDAASLTFTITVNAAAVADTAPSFAQGANIANQTHIVSTTITTLTLPEASGGNGALTYTLTPALPAGLSFNANARTISGIPTMAASMQTYTYTVMDSDANIAGGDSASLMFTITVNAAAVADTAPSFAQGASIADQTHTVNTMITTLTLPEASGGNGALTYTLTPALPAGLSFNANARTISGIPTMAASMQTYTYTVMDSDANMAGGDSASLTFTITVNAAAVADTAPSFAQGASIADQTYTVNTTTTLTLPEASGGNGALTYTLTPALPAGLSFNANARTISGIPTMAASMQTYTYTVMDSDANIAGGDSASLMFTITVNAAAVADTAPSFAQGASIADQTHTVNTMITTLTLPEASGGNGALTYTLTPALPAGLSFNANARTISGIPTMAASMQTYTYTVMDSDANMAGGDSASLTFTITVNAAAVADTAPSFAQGANIANQTHIVSTTITTLTLPEASGGNGALTYTLTPALPAGLSFNANARTISGIPTMAASMQTYTYTVMDSDANMAGGDAANLTFTVTVNAAAVADTAPSFAQGASIADQTHTVNTTTTLTLPEASGGNGALTYALIPALPAGLSFNANARTISGIPTMAASMQTYTYTVMDSDANMAGGDAANLTFTVTVNAAAVADTAPSFAQGASIADQTHTVNTTTTLTLPEASGGNGALTYALIPALPAGLSFNANTRTISGIPTAMADSAIYTYTVMDSDANMAGGDAASLMFTITVNAASLADTRTVATGSSFTIDLSDFLTALSYEAMSTAPGVASAAISGNMLTVTGVLAGTAQVRVIVDEDVVAAFAVIVTGARVSITQGPHTLTAGSGFLLLTANTAKGSLFQWSITGAPSGITIIRQVNAEIFIEARSNARSTDALQVSVTVTDADGAIIGTATTSVQVINPNAPIISISPATVTVTAGTAIAGISITSSGGDVVSYSIAPTLPDGLTLDTSNGTISGTPTAVSASTNYTITATNSSGTDTVTLTITVNAALAAPNIGASLSRLEATAGTLITPITITNNGGAVPANGYSIMPAITNGLSFDASTGTISGTPTAVADAVTYIITATNSADTSSVMVTITVNAALAAPNIGASLSRLEATAGTLITPITITNNGGAVPANGYSIMPAITNGLSFDASTGTISGTPTAVADAVTYIITATNSADTSSVMVTITVNAALAAPNIGASLSRLEATAGTLITPITITNNGGAVPANGYSIMPAITNGLSFDASTGTISGTPTAVADAVTYIITATNSADTSSVMVTITVNAALAAPNIGASLSRLEATAGTLITPITITNNGGAVPANGYSIMPAITNGLSFDASTGTISGTPTAVADAVTYIITATNSADTSSVMVTITVNAALAAPNIGASLSRLEATAGTLITPITITNNGGAVPANGYSIMPAITNGLSFDASTGTISGTPTAVADAVTYIITATNSADTSSVMVTITVNAALAAPNIGASLSRLEATAGTLITPITITNNGGAVPANGYSIMPAITNGLSFDASTGTISGTPTAVADAVTYIITATNSADTSSVMVTITVTASARVNALTKISTYAQTDGSPVPTLMDYTAAGVTGVTTDNLDIVNAAVLASTATEADTTAEIQTLVTKATDDIVKRIKQLNTAIMPRLTQAMLATTLTSISSRLDSAFSGAAQSSRGQLDGVSLGAQPIVLASFLQKLPSYVDSLQEGNTNWRRMLANSSFTLSPQDAQSGSAKGLTVWGIGDYSSLGGKDDSLDWDGEVFTVQLGIDKQLNHNLLVGGLVSWSDGDVDADLVGIERNSYKHRMISVHPYLAWSGKHAQLWGSLGYGQGKLKTGLGNDNPSLDTRLVSMVAGGEGRLSNRLSLKSDIALAQTDIDGSSLSTQQDTNSQRLRLLLKTDLICYGHYTVTLEAGARYDHGDGDSGLGAVLDASMAYNNPGSGLTIGAKLHTLLGRDNYSEWGLSGLLELATKANGRGLAFSLSPSYSLATQDSQAIWQENQLDSANNLYAADQQMQLDTRLSYGLLAFAAQGLLTPYSEVTFGDTNSYRLGIHWQGNNRLDLDLFGEHRASHSHHSYHSRQMADQAIMLKGKFHF